MLAEKCFLPLSAFSSEEELLGVDPDADADFRGKTSLAAAVKPTVGSHLMSSKRSESD